MRVSAGIGQNLFGKQLQLSQAADLGYQQQQIQATGRVLGDDVLDLADGPWWMACSAGTGRIG
jgi:hypothetical protein